MLVSIIPIVAFVLFTPGFAKFIYTSKPCYLNTDGIYAEVR